MAAAIAAKAPMTAAIAATFVHNVTEAFRARWRDMGIVIGVTRIGVNSEPGTRRQFWRGTVF